jgi:hypothetical protein
LTFETVKLVFETVKLVFETVKLAFETVKLVFETAKLAFETPKYIFGNLMFVAFYSNLSGWKTLTGFGCSGRGLWPWNNPGRVTFE